MRLPEDLLLVTGPPDDGRAAGVLPPAPARFVSVLPAFGGILILLEIDFCLNYKQKRLKGLAISLLIFYRLSE